MQKLIIFILAAISVFVIVGCSSLTPQQEQSYREELKETEDLDWAVAVYKAASGGSPLENQARLRVIAILRDYELPKAKTVKDFCMLDDRLAWNMNNLKRNILIYAISEIDDIHELQKLSGSGGDQAINLLVLNKIQRLKEQNQKVQK